MATEFYKLPTINDEADTISFCDAVNGLATSMDQTLEDMRLEFISNPYQLPAATKGSLGGVRIGDGWINYSDGEITPKDSKYVLPAANKDNLGGVKAGQNIGIDSFGKINVEEGAYNLDDFKSDMFANQAITTAKIREGAVTEAHLASDISATINKVNNLFKNYEIYKFPLEVDSSQRGTFVVRQFGGKWIVLAEINTNFYSIGINNLELKIGKYGNVLLSDILSDFGSFLVPVGVYGYTSTTAKDLNSYCFLEVDAGNNVAKAKIIGAGAENTNSGAGRGPNRGTTYYNINSIYSGVTIL